MNGALHMLKDRRVHPIKIGAHQPQQRLQRRFWLGAVLLKINYRGQVSAPISLTVPQPGE